MAVGIPRGRLVAQAALIVFVFGGTWMVIAGHIANVVGRCLAMEGPMLADGKCCHLMTYPPAVAVISLLLMLALCIREAQAESKVGKAGGGAQAYHPYRPEVGFAVGPKSSHLRGSDAVALAVMLTMYLCCFIAMIFGLLVRYAGYLRELQHPADKGAAALAETGSVIALAGCLSLWFEFCCLAILYVMLRLRRFIRANWAMSLSA